MKDLLRIFLIAGSVMVVCGCRLLGAANSTFSGTLEMNEHSLGAPGAGRLIQVFTEEGQEIKKGQEIAVFERYEQAKRDYERLCQLQKSGAVRVQDVEHAKLAMDEQRVISPIDGIVLMKIRQAGEVVTAGAPIVVVGDTSVFWMKIYVPENQISRVKVGDEAKIRLDGNKEPYRARVSYISPEAQFTPRNIQTKEERITQTFAVKVKMEDISPRLRPGIFGDVELQLHD